ncbi:MAG: phosphoribosylamine--glycine ligase [Bacteriovorax sp.]|nr:phosphoribosylamine--glycine ligase [Bacteriovorax sp.]
MKVLVIGNGGREHALCHHLGQTTSVSQVFVAPGNSAMNETLPELQVVSVSAMDMNGLLELALNEKIDLTVVGPEATLSEGIVDLFQENNLLIVGPSKTASQLETSKAFAKKIMMDAGVPTAGYSEFFDADTALKYIETSPSEKMVVKCDGLAQGKGVVVCMTKYEARIAVISLMKEKILGENIDHIIIEEFLEGTEVSAFALCDGESFSFLGTACDHKRLRDGDLGPNTGGMGVFSPASCLETNDEKWINENVFAPMLSGMKKAGASFSGILFAGLMKTKLGWKVLEFNVRFGDPETQVLLPLLEENLAPWLKAAANGEIKKLQDELGRLSPAKKDKSGVHVVMAAHGYPGTEGVKVRLGDTIHFLNTFELGANDYLYFAGVEKNNGQLKTKGGRVLGITSLAKKLTLARQSAYEHISKVQFDGAQFRTDIGKGQV